MPKLGWMLTDAEIEQVIKDVKAGTFLFMGMVCPDYEVAIAVAQARKLVEYIEMHFNEVEYGEKPPWKGLWILRSWWARLRKEVGDET